MGGSNFSKQEEGTNQRREKTEEPKERGEEVRPLKGSRMEDKPEGVSPSRKFDSNSSGGQNFDPNRTIERSLSDATLISQTPLTLDCLKHLQDRASSVDNLREGLRTEATSPMSERSTVYEDLSSLDTVEAGSTENQVKRLRLKMRNPDLETIQQDDYEAEALRNDGVAETTHSADFIKERSQRNSTNECDCDLLRMGSSKASSPVADGRTGHRNSMGLVEFESEGSLDENEGSQATSFYTKYPLRFPHGYSLMKYRHNLKLSYQTLSQRLEGFICSMREASEKQQCRILTDVLLLIKEAWDTPVYGRDLAYGLCDIMRMEGLVDLLIHNCGLVNNQDIMLHSANLLEQVRMTCVCLSAFV